MPHFLTHDTTTGLCVRHNGQREYRNMGSTQLTPYTAAAAADGVSVLVLSKPAPGGKHPPEVLALVAANVPPKHWKVSGGSVVEWSDAEKIPGRLAERIAEVQAKTEQLRSLGFIHGSHVHGLDTDSTLGFLGLDKVAGKSKFTEEVNANGAIPLACVNATTGALEFCMLSNAADVSSVYDALEDREMAIRIGELRKIQELAGAAAVSLAALEAVTDDRT